MNKWIRNLLIGVFLTSIKKSKIGKRVLKYLSGYKTSVGRAGIGAFTILGIVKYYNPEFPLDDGVEIFGILFSWLALEIGLEDKIQEGELLAHDPKKEYNIDLGKFVITIPPTEELTKNSEIPVDKK